MSTHEVWGFTIERSPSGKKIWPNKLKREAARLIREDNVSPGDVAAEIGAHECLVRKWSVADRRSRGELFTKEEPTFVPIQITHDGEPSVEAASVSGECGLATLEYNRFRLVFPVDVPEQALSAIIRVMRHAT